MYIHVNCSPNRRVGVRKYVENLVKLNSVFVYFCNQVVQVTCEFHCNTGTWYIHGFFLTKGAVSQYTLKRPN